MRPDELERRLQASTPSRPDRTDRIGEFYSYPESRDFAELLIDCEEDRTLWAVLVGMLRESGRVVLATGRIGSPRLRCSARR
jgi:hypothetical protein